MFSVLSRFTLLCFKVLTLFFIGFIIWGQWMEGLYPGAGGVANWAHIGGALGGAWFLYVYKGKL